VHAHCQDFIALDKYVDAFEQQIALSHNSSDNLFRIKTQLLKYMSPLSTCIKNESYKLQKLKKYMFYLERSHESSYLKNQYAILSRTNNVAQDDLNLCYLIRHKILKLEKEIDLHIDKLYQDSFLKKYDSFVTNFKKIALADLSFLPFFDALRSDFLISGRILNFLVFGAYLGALLVFNFYAKRKKILAILPKIDVKRFIYAAAVFLVLSPGQFLLMKTSFAHRNMLLLDLYHKPIYLVAMFCVFNYLYLYGKFAVKLKDCLYLAFTIFAQCLLVVLFYNLRLFELSQQNSDVLLFLRYIILIVLQLYIYWIFYWSFCVILGTKISRHINLIKVLFFLSVTLFTLGLFGFIDMAVNIKLAVICCTIYLVLAIILTRVKNAIVAAIFHSQSRVYGFLNRYFENYFKKIVFNITVIIYYVYALLFVILVVSSMVVLVWFLPGEFLIELQSFVYGPHLINKIPLRVIDVMYAFLAFFMLNIANYCLAIFLSKKLFKDAKSSEKASQIMHAIGLIIVFFIVLNVAGIHLENFIIVLGGLSVGIGFGMNSIISSFLSSISLFVSRPFDVGDYVSINDTKGFIKKINFMETIIETPDKNIYIFPNKVIASSIIENFNYEHKKYHNVHVNYVLEYVSAKKQNMVTEIIRQIMLEDSNVFYKRPNDVKFIFSPAEKSTDELNLEINFYCYSIKDIEENIAKINYKIFSAMKKIKLDVKFDCAQHPLKD